MKWVAIAGSWKISADGLEQDVRSAVKDIMSQGYGVVSGGALGVDYVATEEALANDPSAKRIKIFIPTTLDIFSVHYRNRAREGVITEEQAEGLIAQLQNIKEKNPASVIEGADLVLDKTTYFNRITKIVEAADELYAFQVNKSEGTQDTIDKARRKGIPVKVFSYEV